MRLIVTITTINYPISVTTSKLYLLFSVLVLCCSCSITKPKDFSYTYNNTRTGLDSVINTNGYYIVQRECDSTFFSVFMFYPDGLFAIATGTDLSEIVKCYGNDDKSTICDYITWGLYQLEGDTIKTQSVRPEGMTSISIFRDYRIAQDKSLISISDYVYPENTNIGYLRSYPSFQENPCPVKATFYPLSNKRSKNQCPLLKQKWFTKH